MCLGRGILQTRRKGVETEKHKRIVERGQGRKEKGLGKKNPTFKIEKELNRREGSGERETMLFLLIICDHCPVSWLIHVMEGNQVPQPHV